MNALIDIATLDSLAEIMGDDMQMLLITYIDDSTKKINEMCQMDLLTQQDAIFKAMHSLKGSSQNLGIHQFSHYCEKAEQLAREGKLNHEHFSPLHIKSLFSDSVNAIKSQYLQKSH
jgi:HPt (histidine-containing phosphotransfer) domain-containing protein